MLPKKDKSKYDSTPTSILLEFARVPMNAAIPLNLAKNSFLKTPSVISLASRPLTNPDRNGAPVARAALTPTPLFLFKNSNNLFFSLSKSSTFF